MNCQKGDQRMTTLGRKQPLKIYELQKNTRQFKRVFLNYVILVKSWGPLRGLRISNFRLVVGMLGHMRGRIRRLFQSWSCIHVIEGSYRFALHIVVAVHNFVVAADHKPELVAPQVYQHKQLLFLGGYNNLHLVNSNYNGCNDNWGNYI